MTSLNKEAREAAVLELLRNARLSESDVSTRLAQATSRDYWNELCPALSVERISSYGRLETRALQHAENQAALNHLATLGYFQLEPLFDPNLICTMRECVDRLRERGWPIVFAFMYDEFWALTRVPSIASLLASALGTGYKQAANIWTYYVPALTGAGGWQPHVDSADPGCTRLTIWIPLTDATVENGCMYVIARDKVAKSLPSNYMDWDTIRIEEFRSLMQGVKAMPASAGAVLGWDQFVIHWGARVGRTSSPRISLAVEFVAAGATPRGDVLPLMDPGSLPSFSQRLYAVGKGLLDYKRFEPIADRFAALAERLMLLRE